MTVTLFMIALGLAMVYMGRAMSAHTLIRKPLRSERVIGIIVACTGFMLFIAYLADLVGYMFGRHL
jgi:hypothetical protein